MIRVAGPVSIAAAFWGLALVALAALQAWGYVDNGVLELSGKAIMAAEGRGTIEEVVTTYPPLPLLLSLPFAFAAPAGIPPAALAAALLAGVFGATLYYGFRAEGISRIAAFIAVLFLLANPFAIYAVASGPGVMLMMLALLLLARGLFGLSGEAAAPDMMMVAIALVILAFAHPFGLILAIASVPGFALAAPPAMIARTPGSLFLLLLFPLLFSFFSFVYTRWALGADPWSVFRWAMSAAPSETSGVPASAGGFALEMLPAIALTAPLMTAFVIWTYRRPSLLLPAVALVFLVVIAAVLEAAFRGHGEKELALAISLAAAGACALQVAKDRMGSVLVLLLAGVGGAFLTIASPTLQEGEPWRIAPTTAGMRQLSVAKLGEALCETEGVLVDTDAHPDVVQVCATAKSLIVAGEAEFEIQVQSRRLTSPYVLVGAPETALHLDRLALTFPNLYEHGAPGYALVYSDAGWRVYARTAAQPEPWSGE